MYVDVILLQKKSESLLQRSCVGVMLLEVAACEVKSFMMTKISLLLLVLVSIRFSSAMCLVFRICW